MAFPDPITFVADGDSISLPRTGFDGSTGTFLNEDGDVALKVSFTHSEGKRKRHTMRVDILLVTPDALNPSINVPISASVYLTVDVPRTGIPNADMVHYVQGICDFLTASTNANTVKLLSGQS